jgi:hypothetical protein
MKILVKNEFWTRKIFLFFKNDILDKVKILVKSENLAKMEICVENKILGKNEN